MILHDTIYEWDGKSRDGEKPVCWWPGSYRIRIVNLDAEGNGVFYIKPMAVICKNRAGTTSAKTCFQDFARKISKKYVLEMTKVLWVEIERSDPSDIQVAIVSHARTMGGQQLFSVEWRPIRPNELTMLNPYLSDFTDDPPDRKSPA